VNINKAGAFALVMNEQNTFTFCTYKYFVNYTEIILPFVFTPQRTFH